MDKKDFLKKSKYFKWMTPEEGVELFERANDFVWENKPGIYCSVPKETLASLSAEDMEKETLFWKERRLGHDRFSIISVFHPGHVGHQNHREAADRIILDTFKAVAILSDSALGRMGLKMFLAIKPPKGYEIKIFADVAEAQAWIFDFYL